MRDSRHLVRAKVACLQVPADQLKLFEYRTGVQVSALVVEPLTRFHCAGETASRFELLLRLALCLADESDGDPVSGKLIV